MGTTPGAFLGAALLGVLFAGTAWADDPQSSDVAGSEARKPSLRESLMATSSAHRPLNLLLTQSELVAVVRNYEIKTGESFTEPIGEEEILVTAPGYLAPMRDPSQDVGGGLLAPFWMIMHPKDAWRVFAPIPPKGPYEEARPIRAEDRVTRPISALESTGMPSN